MATNFPTSLDVLTNPTSTDSVATVDHASQHANANDAIEALQAKVGANSSAVTTTHDYKLSEVTSTDVAVGKTATQTLTNKTLTTPTIGSFTNATHNHQNAAGGGTLDAAAITAGTLALARGGTGASLVDPNADRILFWDDSAGQVTFLTAGTGLSITGTTIENSSTNPTALTLIPKPVMWGTASVSGVGVNSNTTQTLVLVELNKQITVNKLTIEASAVAVAGTLDLVVYSEDGQTQLINVTTATISGTGNVTTNVSAVTLNPGNYWLGINPNSTADITIYGFGFAGIGLRSVSSEPVLVGTTTITASTPASTFTPSGLTVGTGGPLFRFDN